MTDLPRKQDLDLYTTVLNQVRVRANAAGSLLTEPYSYPRLESAALQLRMVLELIPLGALVTHRELVEPVASAFQKKKPQDAAHLVRRVNPDYWPKPVHQVVSDKNGVKHELMDVEAGFVTEREWLREWGYLSGVVHARNPYRGEPEIPQLRQRLDELLDRIVTLLSVHWLDLPNRDYNLLGIVKGEDDGLAHAFVFRRDGEEDADRPWEAELSDDEEAD